jgi:cell division protein FtsQ
MIEYKAYHKKSLGKRKRPHAARRKKKKGREETPGRTRFMRSIPIVAAVLAFLLLGAAGAAAYSWLGRSAIFSVRVVDMNPCDHVSKDEISGMLKGVARGNIWSLSKEEIGRRILSHPFAREVAVRKAFPDKLVVNIEEREPVAMINLDALYYVDEQGAIFKRLTAYDSKNLPILTGFSRGDLAAKDPVTIRILKKTIDLLRHTEAGILRRNISEVHFDAQDGYTLVTRDFGLQLKIGTMEFPKAMERVEEAMQKLASLGQSKGVVDLKTEGRIFVRPGE